MERLDGINLYRFREDPEKRGAWLAARDVVWRKGRQKGAAGVETTSAARVVGEIRVA